MRVSREHELPGQKSVGDSARRVAVRASIQIGAPECLLGRDDHDSLLMMYRLPLTMM